MASPDGSTRRVLKAKKTMPPSCRKQVELLNKSKIVETLKTATIGNNVRSSNQNFSTVVIQNNCRLSENGAFSLDSSRKPAHLQKSSTFPQHLIEPLEKIVDSETRLNYIDGEVVGPYPNSAKTIFSFRKLFLEEAKDSQNSFGNHFESQANKTLPMFELRDKDGNLKSICCSPNVLSSCTQIPTYTVASTLDAKGNNTIVSYLEIRSKLESHDKNQNNNLNSDFCFVPVQKTPNLANSGSSNCTADGFKMQESSNIYHSSISDCGSTDSTWHSSLSIGNNNSHNQKKRMFAENKENVKRMRTLEQTNDNITVALEKQRTFLEQVKHLIHQEISIINCKVFDNKLQELNERIGKTQCSNKHEAIADELFAKIGKLQRRIKQLLLSQRNYLEPDMLSSNVACKDANSETMNLDRDQESLEGPNEEMTSVDDEHAKPSEKANEQVNLSLDHVELVSESHNDDVMLISVGSPNLTTSITSNQTDMREITSRNSNSSPDVETDVMKQKLDSVIDLTKAGLSICKTESPVSSPESPSKAVLNSKETTSEAQIAAQVPGSFEHLPPLPGPSPPPLPELVEKIRDTLPPQKPELKVKRVMKPRGVALTWNITKINPKCAPVESYHLFLCHESPTDEPIWKKIAEMKALPLPMACSVSQFLVSKVNYFTIQSKDIFGRYGPFCDIKAVRGFSETLT
ncbi:PREDICTED: activating transcription factor 7-interacting protein 2 [Chrysochloris asiatica]|uniref:Activating transcription factor 7-interacting protein 2 n=1 Tax=Chrysochloris asiatica TaxID=185453 RepID=A0A9B0TNT2_CHRAS|nr:PREDICTED: activating transcription factor 7-interacting protein 2 [Chrysochloris asiatica]